MERHRIPQNIMDVEFKLFGNLTVKQFGSLAFNFLIAFLFYLLKLPPLIGLPLMGFFILLGLAMAFVQINGLPFSRWLANFILALFTPQSKVWKKSPKIPKTFTQTFKVPKHSENSDFHKEMGQELMADPEVIGFDDSEDASEKRILNNIDKMLSVGDKQQNEVTQVTNAITESNSQEGIYGKVLSSKGNPISDITIALLDPQLNLLEEVQTDARGVFNFKVFNQFKSFAIEVRWIDRNSKIHHVRKPIDLNSNPNISPIVIKLA